MWATDSSSMTLHQLATSDLLPPQTFDHLMMSAKAQTLARDLRSAVDTCQWQVWTARTSQPCAGSGPGPAPGLLRPGPPNLMKIDSMASHGHESQVVRDGGVTASGREGGEGGGGAALATRLSGLNCQRTVPQWPGPWQMKMLRWIPDDVPSGASTRWSLGPFK